jgi:hypothetical protein
MCGSTMCCTCFCGLHAVPSLTLTLDLPLGLPCMLQQHAVLCAGQLQGLKAEFKS